MIYQNLQFSAPLDAAGAAAVKDALRSVAGIREVGAAEGERDVAIAFNGALTSIQEITNVLVRAGFPLQQAPKASAGCCGGCGGGH
jgi:copper chaperone CopZ